MEQLAEVAQVGEQPLAVDAAPHQERPAAQHVCDLAGQMLAAGIEGGRVVAEEAGEGGRAHQAGAVRLGHRLQQRRPLGRGGRAQQVAATGQHRRDAARLELALHEQPVVADGHQHRHLLGHQGLAAPGRARGEELGDVGGAVGGHRLAGLTGGDQALAQSETVARQSAQPERGRVRRPDQPGLLVHRADRVDDDAGIPQGGAAQHHLQPLDQRGVGAPVDPEGGPVGGVASRGEVGHDVAAAEGVDRLLGVADEHHRRVAVERAAQHTPLDRVGVLELVDQDHPPPVAHPLARGRGRVGEGGVEAGEQVVVAEQPEPPLAPVELTAYVAGELHPRLPGRGGAGCVGDVGLRVADGGAPELEGDVAAERRRLAVGGEAAEVEVVDHLDHEVVEVLDEPGTGLGVAGDTERAQHQLAELMGGGDGRAVEVGERVAQPLAHRRAL